ncbi:transferrin-binding protein-like solute binding protein [Conchiformibius kuhniae]|uniref:Transferrin-binding protein-like solute binding protein n=1 Tax=Conchiformibius kuhniae TaxID=211502 RepID=A0A8T9MUU0_9NEIS|nr:transferrin-binding protein-like solute binding protein [Conchiformibius kuhniae]UOP04266.1 transferrin-binding protein-like solute binding protein [Conchiformibius kuhniae]
MDKKLTAVLVTAVFGLAACGSGGGGSGVITTGSGGSSGGKGGASAGGSSANNTGASSSAGNQSGSSTGGSAPAIKVLAGLHASLDVNPASEQAGKFVPAHGDWKLSKSMEAVEIEGRVIQLIPTGKGDAADGKEDGFYEGSNEKIYTGTSTAPYHQDPSNSWRMIGTHLKHARYGEIYDEYEKRHTLTVGDATPEDKIKQMTEAKGAIDKEIKYTGKALHVEAAPYFNAAAFLQERRQQLDNAENNVKGAYAAWEGAVTAVENAKLGGDAVAIAAAETELGRAHSNLQTAADALNGARQGLATAQEGVKSALSVKPVPVQSEFFVNFGNKTVVGTIKDENNPDFKINLKGTFGKKADYSDTDPYRFGGKDSALGEAGAIMEGTFHGDNAEELTGIYINGTSHGTFGAAKE